MIKYYKWVGGDHKYNHLVKVDKKLAWLYIFDSPSNGINNHWFCKTNFELSLLRKGRGYKQITESEAILELL